MAKLDLAQALTQPQTPDQQLYRQRFDAGAISAMRPPEIVQQAADYYAHGGWQILPVPDQHPFENKQPLKHLPRVPTKGPRRFDWAKFTCAPQDAHRFFYRPSNLSVILGDPSRGLVDIDLDSTLARELAPVLLPPTAAVFGRDGNPRSHFLYRVVDGAQKSVRFRMPGDKKDVLVEYRANGSQTVFPPSLHEDTLEQVKWYETGLPTEVTREQLHGAVKRLAAVVVLERIGWVRSDAFSWIQAPNRKALEARDVARSAIHELCKWFGLETNPEYSGGVGTVSRARPGVNEPSDYTREIVSRVSIQQALRMLGTGIELKANGRGDCPVKKHGGGDDPLSLVNPEVWKCFGCQTTGNVIGLVEAVLGVSYPQARNWLAGQIGFRMDRHARALTTPIQVPAQGRVLDGVAGWARYCRSSFSDVPVRYMRILVRTLLENKADEITIRRTLREAMGSTVDEATIRGTVIEVQHRLANGKKVPGAFLLRRRLGRRAVLHLARAVADDLGLDFPTIATQLLFVSRYYSGSKQRATLQRAYREMEVPRTPEEKKRSTYNTLRRPTGCGQFRCEAWGDGVKNAELNLRCNVHLVCPGCAWSRAQLEYNLLAGTATHDDPDIQAELNRLSWKGRGPWFRALWVTVPNRAMVQEIQDDVTRYVKRPRVLAHGVDGVGQSTMLWVSDCGLSEVRSNVISALRSKGLDDTRLVKELTTQDHVEAARWIFSQRISLQIFSDTLLMNERIPELQAFLSFYKGKHLVSASRKAEALPFPTREELKRAVKSDVEVQLYPEQVIEWRLVHNDTNLVLAKQLYRPYSMDQALTIAANSYQLREAQEVERGRALAPA